MTVKLSERLLTIASLVTPGYRVADVGTDHGYVPIYLTTEGKCPKAYAMDINEGPLSKAKEHIKEYGLENKIQTRLSDGLAALDPGEAETIVIAGMGGLLMKKILMDKLATVYSAKELILSPQSDIPEFRAFLREKTLGITKERLVFEDGKYYWIFKCVPHRGIAPSNIPANVSSRFGEYLFQKKEPMLKQYLEVQEQKLSEILSGMEGKVAEPERMEAIREELQAVKEGLAILEG